MCQKNVEMRVKLWRNYDTAKQCSSYSYHKQAIALPLSMWQLTLKCHLVFSRASFVYVYNCCIYSKVPSRCASRGHHYPQVFFNRVSGPCKEGVMASCARMIQKDLRGSHFDRTARERPLLSTFSAFSAFPRIDTWSLH